MINVFLGFYRNTLIIWKKSTYPQKINVKMINVFGMINVNTLIIHRHVDHLGILDMVSKTQQKINVFGIINVRNDQRISK